MEKYSVSLTEAASVLRINRQSVWLAIKHGHLAAQKIKRRWYTNLEEMTKYHLNRYSREKSLKENGELLYDKSKGEFSAGEIAKLCDCSIHRIYFLVRKGRLPFFRHRYALVIQGEDLSKIKEIVNAYYND